LEPPAPRTKLPFDDPEVNHMLNKTRSEGRNSLFATVQECLPELEALALKIYVYGDQADDAKLRGIIGRLRSASPTQEPKIKAPTDFVVHGIFKVSRQQVANTLWYGFAERISWFRIADTVPPRELRFRSIDQTNPGIVDYPLNDGGMVRLVSTGAKPEIFELRLDVITRGLDVLASCYPRHFADLVNENSDSINSRCAPAMLLLWRAPLSLVSSSPKSNPKRERKCTSMEKPSSDSFHFL
jgi:hypothetical protein